MKPTKEEELKLMELLDSTYYDIDKLIKEVQIRFAKELHRIT